MLMPNLIYYCGLHLKEIEMTFLIILFLERTDYVIRSQRYNFINISLPILAASLLFFFRTVIGVTAIFSFFTALAFSSSRILGWGKRILLRPERWRTGPSANPGIARWADRWRRPPPYRDRQIGRAHV